LEAPMIRSDDQVLEVDHLDIGLSFNMFLCTCRGIYATLSKNAQ
jgi:hypothetical protein